MFRNITTLVGAALILIFSLSAQAQVEQVTLRVDGLACPFCAYGVEKKIKKLQGYKSFTVLINEGKVIVGWRKDKTLDIAAIQKAVNKAGFTLRGIRGRFVGTVTKDGEKYFLELPKPIDQRLYLYDPISAKKTGGDHIQTRQGGVDAITDAWRKRLDQAITDKTTVRIVGPVHQHMDTNLPAAIGIEQMENLQPPATATGIIRVHKQDADTSAQLRLIDQQTNQIIELQLGTRADWRDSYDALLTKAKASTDKKRPFRARVHGEARSEISSGLVLHQWEPVNYGAQIVMHLEQMTWQQSTPTTKVLRTLDDVIHAQSDPVEDRVQIWTTSASPDVKRLRKRIKLLGFKVKDVRTYPGKSDAEQVQQIK